MSERISVRFYWDGSLKRLAYTETFNLDFLPKVGDTMWVREYTPVPEEDWKPGPPVPAIVIERGYELWWSEDLDDGETDELIVRIVLQRTDGK